MNELEGTPEFNRGFRAIVGDLNGAALDPVPQGELYDKWQEYVQDRYEPFQQIVPDDHEGFDINGDFHAVEHFTVEGIGQALTPFRWRDYLQDAITQYAANHEYTLGASERYDLAQDIVSERMEACDTNLERLQLEKALELWREMYGRGYGIRP